MRFECINQAVWHHYKDAQTKGSVPAIGLRQFYRFYGEARLDAMTITPPLVRWGSTDNRALPAQLDVYAWDEAAGEWGLARKLKLPRPPQGASHHIDLGGLRTRFLRLDCLKQHAVPPNGGEQWANPQYVPFDTLKQVEFHGKAVKAPQSDLPIQPPLTIVRNRPSSGKMKVLSEVDHVHFSSPAFAMGFSLRRPMISHCGWDGARDGKAADNLIFHRTLQLHFYDSRPLIGAGDLRILSGPSWSTLGWDAHPRLWGGEVSVEGNIISYKNLHIEPGLSIDAEFEVRPDGMDLRLSQTSTTERETLELDAWRFVWKAQASIMATQGMPHQEDGRTGAVDLPTIWAAPGYGNLSCRQVGGDAARLQVESWRKYDINWSGITFAEPASYPATHKIAPGRKEAQFEFRVADLLPRLPSSKIKVHPEMRRNWGPGLTFRAELGGFSNNGLSTNCHLSQTGVTDLAAHTAPPKAGPAPIELARYTATLALKDGRGYGDSREHYQDSDPSILNMTGRIHQTAPNAEWLADVWPYVRRTTERILSKIDERGLVAAPLATGNYGNKGHVTNGWDCVNFGHYDGYSIVETYRAFRNVVALAKAADDREFSARVKQAAEKMHAAFEPTFYNPATGWLGSWRSRDGELHDYGHFCVNAPACLYGLVSRAKAKKILQRMEARRLELGLNNFRWGLPSTLIPVRSGDYQGGYMENPIWGKGVREDGADGFGIYCNGSLMLIAAYYYVRAMSVFGFEQVADQMCAEILEGHALGRLIGGIRTGTEFYTPEGVACGYEGALVGQFGVLLAIAQHRGWVETFTPEFWAA